MITDIALPDPCTFVSNTGLVVPSNVKVELYCPPVVVYRNNAPAVVRGYVTGLAMLGSSQSKAMPKFIVEAPSGLVNNVEILFFFL